LDNVAVSNAREHCFDRAEEQLRRAIALTPNEAAAYFNLGLVHKSRREGPEAEVALRKAVAIAPDYSQGLDALGEILMAKGDSAGAMSALEESVRLDPYNGGFHNTLGIELAWIFAASETDILPDGTRALALARALVAEDRTARALQPLLPPLRRMAPARSRCKSWPRPRQ
jgi:Flp pilus assembly protein TadD